MTSIISRWSRPARLAVLSAMLAIAAVAVTACGSSGSSGSSSTAGSNAASAGNLSTADKLAAQWAQRPTQIPVSQPIGKPKKVTWEACSWFIDAGIPGRKEPTDGALEAH